MCALQGNPRPAYPLVQKKLTSSDMAAYSLISKATERDVYHMKNTSLGCGVQGSTPRRNQSHMSPSEQFHSMCASAMSPRTHAPLHLHWPWTWTAGLRVNPLSRLTNLLVSYKCLLLTARINQSNNYHNYKPPTTAKLDVMIRNTALSIDRLDTCRCTCTRDRRLEQFLVLQWNEDRSQLSWTAFLDDENYSP